MKRKNRELFAVNDSLNTFSFEMGHAKPDPSDKNKYNTFLRVHKSLRLYFKMFYSPRRGINGNCEGCAALLAQSKEFYHT